MSLQETSVLEEPHHHVTIPVVRSQPLRRDSCFRSQVEHEAVFAMVAAFWGLALCCYSLLHLGSSVAGLKGSCAMTCRRRIHIPGIGVFLGTGDARGAELRLASGVRHL